MYQVRTSGIHGNGVFASEEIPSGVLIMKYTGEILSQDEGIQRYEKKGAHFSAEGDIYLFSTDEGFVIDGLNEENDGRFINHSCSHNCMVQQSSSRELNVVSCRTIQKGEELTIDYGFTMSQSLNHPCECRYERCVGVIVNSVDRQKMRRFTKKAGRSLLKG